MPKFNRRRFVVAGALAGGALAAPDAGGCGDRSQTPLRPPRRIGHEMQGL
jgi:hypothetical protein